MAPSPDTNAASASPSSEYLVADTYSLTDAQLADSIEFLEEIGKDGVFASNTRRTLRVLIVPCT